MLSRGDAVVYKCRGVYKVEEVGKLDFSFVDGKKDYYTLQSIDNQRDKAYVPLTVASVSCLILLDKLTEVDVLNVKNEKYREQEYKECISSFCPENWVKVLKTLYSRTKRRGSMTSMDKKYQMLLEHALSSEMNYVLGIPAGEMTELIKKSE